MRNSLFSLGVSCLILLLGHSHASAATTLRYCNASEWAYDSTLFTQGLELEGQSLLISSGLYGKSRVQRRRVDDFSLLQEFRLPSSVFAEGLTLMGTDIYLLSWKNHRAWRLNSDTLTPIQFFPLPGEGWGLTHNDHQLILSDGSSTLQFLHPDDFSLSHSLNVTLNGKPVAELNELEFVDGAIWANIWGSTQIVKIDPSNGHVIGTLDMAPLVKKYHRSGPNAVLNGIAWDKTRQGFWLTGKLWPVRFFIQLDCPTNPS